VSYSYDGNGKLVSSSGNGTFNSNDGYGNLTSGTIAQSYEIMNGQAKLITSETTSNTVNLDGSTQDQTVTVSYSYDTAGKLTGASGSGTFRSEDGFGNQTSGNILQSYSLVNGQAKLISSQTDSHTVNLDGSSQQQSVIS